ncbi:hypothetical protein J1614_007197 [Plenodomus biglobosus]|nr:hypothetical protein J1614_007197 [Plenodomus biglobosus]
MIMADDTPLEWQCWTIETARMDHQIGRVGPLKGQRGTIEMADNTPSKWQCWTIEMADNTPLKRQGWTIETARMDHQIGRVGPSKGQRGTIEMAVLDHRNGTKN